MQAVERFDFLEEDLDEVQGFRCENAPWELQISDWIKNARTGALDYVHRGKCRVWLYRTEAGELVGYGSLGSSNWNWPSADDPRVPINIIPYVGVREEFWSQPPGPKGERFSAQILDDLVDEALRQRDRHPALGLFVHEDNHRAIAFYRNSGFTMFHRTIPSDLPGDPPGKLYRSMMMEWVRPEA
jgi:GNAT superfamily N-acetyltransferase